MPSTRNEFVMKSSSGKYFIGLDHIRAVAAFMVFTWHFIHVNDGHTAGPPLFPFSILSEGHTGVALFMCLSGYLFAKLLEGRKILYLPFIWNRITRLLPLLGFVIFIKFAMVIASQGDSLAFTQKVLSGIVLPKLPNGGWSITVEFHFYLLLPLLLFINTRSRNNLYYLLAGMILLRAIWLSYAGSVQYAAYFSIIGRLDQFVLGIIMYQHRDAVKGKHFFVGVCSALFLVYYFCFDSLGGFYRTISVPSPSTVWIYLPTLEGFIYALLIAWYDNSFEHSTGRVSRALATVGNYSYSIYLLHFFFVFGMAQYVHENILDLSDMHCAIAAAGVSFFLMIPLAAVTYHFIETPFLKHRVKYTA